MEKVSSLKDLRVYENSMSLTMDIFHLSKKFPREETYSLTDQIRRSSRSVCANLGEAWRKRRYKAAFIAKLSDAEAEASETIVWLEIAKRCGYLEDDEQEDIESRYEHVLAQLVLMITDAGKWVIRNDDNN